MALAMQLKKARRQHSPPPPPARAAWDVLEDDDLLREILLRLDFPTCLVRAALVSRRWYRHASDPAFLRRFRDLHPPRLLGLYVEPASILRDPQFVPLPQPAEMDVVFRRGAQSQPGGWHSYNGEGVRDCRNGCVLVVKYRTVLKYSIASLQQPQQGARVRAELLPTPADDGGPCNHYARLPEDGGDGLSYNLVRIRYGAGGRKKSKRVYAQLCVVQDGTMRELRTSASVQPPPSWPQLMNHCFFAHNKFYLLGQGRKGYILGLELASMSLFFIDLPVQIPDGSVQQQKCAKAIYLSPAQNSGFYLVNLMASHIHVWLHGSDDNTAGNWQLVHTICVRQAIGHLAKPTWEPTVESGNVMVYMAGDNELLLKVEREVFYMHISSGKVEKVFEMPRRGGKGFSLHPFTMLWPPSFPALSNEQIQSDQDQCSSRT